MKGDAMLEVKENLADFLSKGVGLKTANALYAHAEKIGRAKFVKFIKGELNPNAELLTPDLIYLLMFAAQKKLASERAKKGGDGKAAKMREPKEKIRQAWASGNFSSRDICAEQECAALGMSFSAARKALRNTPKPT